MSRTPAWPGLRPYRSHQSAHAHGAIAARRRAARRRASMSSTNRPRPRRKRSSSTRRRDMPRCTIVTAWFPPRGIFAGWPRGWSSRHVLLHCAIAGRCAACHVADGLPRVVALPVGTDERHGACGRTAIPLRSRHERETPLMESRPRFGIWALVHGSRAARQDPEEPFDASWARNHALVREAEALGYDCTLVAQHTFNPYDPDRGQRRGLDCVSGARGADAAHRDHHRDQAAAPTTPSCSRRWPCRSRRSATVALPSTWSMPGTGRRWTRPACPSPSTTRATSWARNGSAWGAAAARRTGAHAGAHFTVQDAVILPRAATRSRPRIYIGGESEPARALAAAKADVWFINGQPIEDVAALIADVARRPRNGPAAALRAFGLRDRPPDRRRGDSPRMKGSRAWPNSTSRCWRARPSTWIPRWSCTRPSRNPPRVGTNGGTAAGLVGSYRQVADRIRAFSAAGSRPSCCSSSPSRPRCSASPPR